MAVFDSSFDSGFDAPGFELLVSGPASGQAWRQVPRWDVLLYQLGATWVVVPLSKVSYSPDNVVDTFYPKAV
jgi:hypothetical protein